MIEWCLQDSSIKMLFAGHEIRDSTKAIRVAARVVFFYFIGNFSNRQK